MKPRLRSAIATKAAIDGIPPSVRAERARHATIREWSQRLAGAQADLQAAQDGLNEPSDSCPRLSKFSLRQRHGWPISKLRHRLPMH
jgi:hypothetical protein